MPAERGEVQLSPVELRSARPADEPALRRLDAESWSPRSTPGPRPDPDRPVVERYGAANVLVAIDGGTVVGSLFLGPWSPLDSSRHILEVKGLAVDPARLGEGIGGALVEAAIARARERGIRHLILRVLSGNDAARRLYERHGFEVVGTVPEAFRLEGAYVDDLTMAFDLTR